jgi:ABC-type nitrate/sulfonate/bicarbonate transport system substrate-binding protein
LGLAGKVRVAPTGPQAGFQLLTSGRVEAANANESTYFGFQQRGYRELINYADHLETLSAGLATPQRLIDTQPDLVQSFVDASYRGMLYFKEHRSESVAMMTRYMKLDAGSAGRVYDLVIGTFGGDGTAPYHEVKKELEARKNILGLTGGVPPYEELFDDRFARRAAAAGIRVQ